MKNIITVLLYFLYVSVYTTCLSQSGINQQNSFEIIPQIGNDNYLITCDYSPTDRFIITGDQEHIIKLWDNNSSKEIRSFNTTGDIRTIDYSPDGKYILSGGGYSITYIELFEAATGKLLTKIETGEKDINSISFSPDSKYALVAGGSNNYGEKGSLTVWNLSNNSIERSFGDSLFSVLSAQFSPDGNYIVSSSIPARMGDSYMSSLWDKNGNFLTKFIGQKSVFSHDSKYILSIQDKGVLSMYDIKQNKQIKNYTYNSPRPAEFVTFSPNGKYIACTIDGKLVIWNVKTNKITQEITLDRFGIKKILFSPSSKYIVYTGEKSIKVYDVESGLEIKSKIPNIKTNLDFYVYGDSVFITQKGFFKYWNYKNIKLCNGLNINDKIQEIYPLKQGKNFLYKSNKALFEYDYDSNSSRQITDNIGKYFCILPNEKEIALFEKYQPVKFLDLSTGLIRTSDLKIDFDLEVINFTPDGKKFVYTNRYEIFVYDKDSNKVVFTSKHFKEIQSIAVSPDGNYFISGGDKGRDSIRLWQFKGFKQIRTFDGWGRSLYFSTDGKSVLSSDWLKVDLWDVATGKNIKSFKTGEYCEAKYAADGKNIFIMSDGVLDYVDIKSGNSIKYMIGANDKDWLVVTNDGYWDASPNGGELVAMVSGMDSWNIDQFAIKYNRPDIILQRLGSANKELLNHYNNQYKKRLRKLGLTEQQLSSDLQVPNAVIENSEVSGKSALLKLSFADEKYQLKKYNIFINDIPVYGPFGKPITGNIANITDNIELIAGKNKIEVSCMNEKGTESYRAVTYADYTKKTSRNLYLLAFGVSKYQNNAYNLQYADKDANDLAQTAAVFKGKGFEKVFTKVFTNEQVTPESIKASKDFVKDANPDDVFILYIAGHGMHDNDAEATYYYLTSNADINNLKNTAIDFETIEDLLQGIPPRNKLFLMDACESGEIDEEDQGQMLAAATGTGIASRGFKKTATELVEVSASTSSAANASANSTNVPTTKRNYLYQKDRYIYNDLTRRSGAIVFSSSKGGELSYERSDIENGLFTENIIKALTTTDADIDKDGTVSTDELRDYVSTQVAKASGDLQHPTVDRDNIYQKFGFGIK